MAKSIFHSVGPEGVAPLRTVTSAALLLVFARPWRTPPTRVQMGWLILYGATRGGMSLLIYLAIERIPIGVAVAIEICGPLAVVLATSRSTRDLLWFTLAAVGLALLVPWPGASTRLDPIGIVLALGAAACWAFYIWVGKRAARVTGTTAVAIGMTCAAVLVLPFGVASAGHRLLTAPVLAYGVAIALFSSTVPFLLEMHALARLSSRMFGVVTSTAPAIAALVGFAAVGERLTPLQGCAVAMMVVASAGCALTGNRSKVSPPNRHVQQA